jgi:hypothetical protein
MVLAKAGSEYHVELNTKLMPAFANTSTLGATRQSQNVQNLVTSLYYIDYMSKEEIKQEIKKTLDQFSESALMDLLSFLKQFPPSPRQSLFSGDHFQRLLIEDKELLERLAQ